MLNILFIGDICGKVGRRAVAQILPSMKKKYKFDFVIANCENVAGGRGVNRKAINELLRSGVDFFTSGDHIWRDKKFFDDLNDPNVPVIRPANYPEDIACGRGFEVIDLAGKGKLGIINLQGWVFMKELVL